MTVTSRDIVSMVFLSRTGHFHNYTTHPCSLEIIHKPCVLALHLYRPQIDSIRLATKSFGQKGGELLVNGETELTLGAGCDEKQDVCRCTTTSTTQEQQQQQHCVYFVTLTPVYKGRNRKNPDPNPRLLLYINNVLVRTWSPTVYHKNYGPRAVAHKKQCASETTTTTLSQILVFSINSAGDTISMVERHQLRQLCTCMYDSTNLYPLAEKHMKRLKKAKVLESPSPPPPSPPRSPEVLSLATIPSVSVPEPESLLLLPLLQDPVPEPVSLPLPETPRTRSNTTISDVSAFKPAARLVKRVTAKDKRAQERRNYKEAKLLLDAYKPFSVSPLSTARKRYVQGRKVVSREEWRRMMRCNESIHLSPLWQPEPLNDFVPKDCWLLSEQDQQQQQQQRLLELQQEEYLMEEQTRVYGQSLLLPREQECVF